MSRVLRIITRMNVGGPATHVVLADRGLAARGWETLLLFGAVERDEIEVDMSQAGVPSRRIPELSRAIHPAADARALAAIAREIRRFRPDIVHTHLSKAGLLGRSAAMYTSRAARIHTFHGTVFENYFGKRSSSVIVNVERFLGARSSRVIALSEQQRADLARHGIAPADRIRTIPLGIELARFQAGSRSVARKKLRVDPTEVVVLAVGRMVPIKRLDRLIRVFKSVWERRPEVRLYLVGDGTERSRLEAMVREMGIDSATRFVGWSTDTAAWHTAADVVVLSSDREGTPLALIEAASAGRPAVAVAVGGVPDVVEDGVTGFVVARLDEAAFADRLLRLVADADLRRRFGEAATKRAARYDSGRLVDDLDRLYCDVLPSGTRRS